MLRFYWQHRIGGNKNLQKALDSFNYYLQNSPSPRTTKKTSEPQEFPYAMARPRNRLVLRRLALARTAFHLPQPRSHAKSRARTHCRRLPSRLRQHADRRKRDDATV